MRKPDYNSLIGELYRQMHPKNLRLFVNEGVGADDSEFAELAQQTDGIVLMNYDQHEETGDPGPIAAQDWFENNLKRVLKVVPKEKLICAIGNYGYNWTMSLPKKGKHGAAKVLDTEDISVQEDGRRRRMQMRICAWPATSSIPTLLTTMKTPTCATRSGCWMR